MIRRLITKLQLAFCLAMAALSVAAGVAWGLKATFPIRNVNGWGLHCEKGTLLFRTMRYSGERPREEWAGLVTLIYDDWDTHWRHFGFEYGRGTLVVKAFWYATTLVGVPLWFPAVVVGIPTAWRARTLLRRATVRRRAAKRLCTSCGYDLRATPGRCPECGVTNDAA